MGRYGIDAGHGVAYDGGAVGIRKEDDLTFEVGEKVSDYLEALGNQVTKCRPPAAKDLNEALYLRCVFANRDKCNVFVSIHFNASPNHDGHGTEVYAISKVGQMMGQSVVNEIARLGFKNRGVKDGSHLYVLKHTDMPAILVECCFCDNAEDMKLLDTDKMAKAIVKGLTGQDAPSKNALESFREWDEIKRATIRTLQLLCNTNGLRDKYGNVLACDGVIGEKTLSALPTLRVDSTYKSFVRIMQDVLILKGYSCGKAGADGAFGQGTLASVKEFQGKHKLAADGIVGNKTWAELLD